MPEKVPRSRKNKRHRRRFNKSQKRWCIEDTDQARCCMCETVELRTSMLTPRVCLNAHGGRSHRICRSCWFDGPNAFATEGGDHKCPGCSKHIPLCKAPNAKEIEYVDSNEWDQWEAQYNARQTSIPSPKKTKTTIINIDE